MRGDLHLISARTNSLELLHRAERKCCIVEWLNRNPAPSAPGAWQGFRRSQAHEALTQIGIGCLPDACSVSGGYSDGATANWQAHRGMHSFFFRLQSQGFSCAEERDHPQIAVRPGRHLLYISPPASRAAALGSCCARLGSSYRASVPTYSVAPGRRTAPGTDDN